MSKSDRTLNKAALYVFLGVLVIASIFAVMMFGPRPGPQSSVFNTTLRYYTKGTQQLYYTDYAKSIVQDVGELGIVMTDYSMEYAVFIDNIIGSREYEMAIIELEGLNAPHLELMFKEGASLNVFNFIDSLDGGLTNELIDNITKELDFYERKNLFYSLQEHLMDDIVPMIPLFTPARAFAYWNNLEGFTSKWGISDSLPYMSFDGLHANQDSVTELKIGVNGWYDLNPLTMTEDGEKLIVSLVMDKLIHTDEKGTPTNYGLIDSWEYENDTTLLLHVRNGVNWQTDVDGIFPSEQLTIDDVMFTLDLTTNPYANLNHEIYKWIDSYEDYNSTTVAVYIDSDPATPEKEPYAFALEDLSIYPFPEYYLNVESTLQEIVNSARWTKFRQNPFGTGKYTYNATNSQLDLTASLDRFSGWHGVGVDPVETTNLVFENIEVQAYPESYAMNLELQEGSRVDIADFGKDPAIKLSVPEDDFKVDFKLENSLIFVAFNLENEIFGGANNFVPTNETGVSKALAIRKAMSFMIQKTLLNDVFHEGLYNLTDSPVSRYFTDYYYQSVTTYPYSLSEAINYLNIAGFNISTETNGATEESSYELVSSALSLGLFTAITITLRKRKRKVT
jgi:hypothetical protein